MGKLEEPILVTGGAGFIGSHLVKRLEEEYKQVVVLDPLSNDSYPLEHPDGVTDFAMTKTIFHLAADMGGVGYFHGKADWSAAGYNAFLSNYVMKYARRDAKVIYTSSACALDINETRLKEKHLYSGVPDQLYGWEKRFSAQMFLNAPFDARVAFLHTIYGPGQDWHEPKAKFPPRVAYKALKAAHTGELELWGDGTARRTFLYIDDCIDRLIMLAEADENPGAVQIGSEVEWSVENIARLCLELVGSDAEIVYQLDQPVGVKSRRPDLSKWRSIFGETKEIDVAVGFQELIWDIQGKLFP